MFRAAVLVAFVVSNPVPDATASEVPIGLREAIGSEAAVVEWPELKVSSGDAYRSDSAVYFVLPVEAKSPLVFPRLDNPIGEARWIGDETKPLKFSQTPTRWSIEFGDPPAKGSRIIVLETVGEPFLPTKPWVAKPDETGTVRLAAHHAMVHGEKLQYEPIPRKNTIGFWTNAEDWAEWRFDVAESGPYVVRILQGCGKGHGGSRAKVGVGRSALEFVVKDTGHFQNFEWRTLGELDLAAGERRLELRAIEKARAAVLDCRAIELVPKVVFDAREKSADE